MVSEAVLFMAIAVGVAFAGQLRRGDPGQRGYLMVLGGILLLTIIAALRADPFICVVALSLGTLVVVVPWILDLAVRACFGREWLAWAVRLASWRTMLMPGAGLARQQTILHGLAVLERRGVDGALAYFRVLAQDADDDTELRVIHEQIVSMLLFGQRWSEGIAHYEARFPPGYAAQRPPLALGLLRAYGESGKLDSAAGLLRAIEELLGRDPRAAGVVSQARLTFLAYAGLDDPVTGALTNARMARLGLSAASGALFRGIALSRAGQLDAAQVELRRVEDLAGSRDDRVVHASRKAMAHLPSEAVALPPELSRYAERVAARLEGFLTAAPSVRRAGPLWITPALLVGLAVGYLGVLAWDGGGAGLLRLGAATPALIVEAGQWGRVFTGLWVQTDPIGMLLSVYGVWLAGPLVERILGRARVVLVSVGAATAGLAAAVVTNHEPSAVLSGATLLATGLVTAGLWILLSPATALPRRTRRVLALPLVLLLTALAVTIPRSGALDVSPVGMLVTVVLALLLAMPPARSRWTIVQRGVAAVLGLAGLAAVAMVAMSDPHAVAMQQRRPLSARGIELSVPQQFVVVNEVQPADGAVWPLQPGLHDALAQRVGHRVQLLVTAAAGQGEPSALLRIDPALGHALIEVEGEAPAAWEEAYRERAGADGLAALRITTLRRNGEDVALVIERSLEAVPGADCVVLVASPPAALAHDAELYAAILGDAAAAVEDN
ncbi:MAG: rhomboid family intramembrane serine protease [Deltaproteobacteria bacterium]|nr:rhomboid family intramembrane serine protease [Deltaproteobacteria bacterium]